MPKKTRRHKIRADIHKKSYTAPATSADLVKSQNASSEHEDAAISPQKFVYTHHPVTAAKTAAVREDYSHVRRDAIKITMFTVGALVFQGVLYFVINRG